MIETRAPYPDTESLPVETFSETRPTPERPKTPREVGEHAARYIEEHGWLQVGGAGRLGDGRGACIVNALSYVTKDRALIVAAENALGDVVGVEHWYQVWFWNDAPERTEAEVLAALRSIR